MLAHDRLGKEGHPTVVCVNGIGATRRTWWPLMRHFVRTHHILTYDHRGSGESGSADEGGLPTLADYRTDLADLVDATGFAGATFVGFSFGGRVCLDLTLARPELVGALVLVSTSAGGPVREGLPPALMEVAWQRFDVTSSRWLNDVVPTLFGPDYLRRRQRELQRLGAAGVPPMDCPDAMARQWLAIAGLDVREHLGAIDRPCLVLQGGVDRLCPPREGRDLAERIRRARLRVYPNLGHVPHLEDPGPVARDLATFLRDLPGSSRAEETCS